MKKNKLQFRQLSARLFLGATILSLLHLSGCGKKNEKPPEFVLSDEKGSRDNTPVCLVPEASGTKVLGNDAAQIDVSNASQGYLIARYTGTCPKVKLQITGEDQITYTYNLTVDSEKEEVFPFSAGSGHYKIGVYENIQNTQYATAFVEEMDVALDDEFLPFLYPNQYVAFTEEDTAIQKGVELARPANEDLDVVGNVYNYIVSNVTYDHEEAETVQSGYLPDIDEVLSTQKGICLDYACLMAAILRSQRIPTRVEVGYAGNAYHAWISTYIEDIGWVNGIIEFDGTDWSLMDPTFASNMSDKKLKNFIGDGANYTMRYIY